MKTEIKKGDRFICIKDLVMDNEETMYIKGKEYTSEQDKCITNEEGNINHLWLSMDSGTCKYFERSSSVDAKLITRFPSGAVRSDSTGRPRPDWISPYAIEEISKVMVNNANDFGACNYMLGIPELACLSSLVRHVGELQEALLITKDINEAKVIARSVGFNVTAMLHTMVLKEKGLYKEVYERTELVTVEEAKKGNEYLDK